jgi:hypothetical protein
MFLSAENNFCIFFYQRKSAKSAAQYLLLSFFKHQKQRKEFWPLIAQISAD